VLEVPAAAVPTTVDGGVGVGVGAGWVCLDRGFDADLARGDGVGVLLPEARFVNLLRVRVECGFTGVEVDDPGSEGIGVGAGVGIVEGPACALGKFLGLRAMPPQKINFRTTKGFSSSAKRKREDPNGWISLIPAELGNPRDTSTS